MIKLPIECCSALLISGALAWGLITLVPDAGAFANARSIDPPVANVAIIADEIVAPKIELSTERHVISRAPDGLFYVEAQANGQTIRFVIDTGATVIVLNRVDAKKMGIAYDELVSSAEIKTVAGPSAMRWTTIHQLEAAGHQFEELRAAVVDKDLPVSLLGQNALSRLGSVTMRGDEITIN